MNDFTFSFDGSLVLVTPETVEAREWLIEHTHEDSQYFGNSLVVEPRYADDLLSGLREAGFTVRT